MSNPLKHSIESVLDFFPLLFILLAARTSMFTNSFLFSIAVIVVVFANTTKMLKSTP